MIDRIKQLMNSKHLSPAQLAERLDINRSNLTHLFSGRNQPSLDLVKKILHAFPEISTDWLIMGVGEMKKTDTVENESVKPSNIPAELDLFSSLPSIEKTFVNESGIVRRKKNVSSSTFQESNNPVIDSNGDKKINSHDVKNVEKIIFFYNDKTFEVYCP